MKSLLTLVTLALAALIVEERTRELAADARSAVGQVAGQARDGTDSLAQTIRQQPLISLLISGGLAYVLASMFPKQ